MDFSVSIDVPLVESMIFLSSACLLCFPQVALCSPWVALCSPWSQTRTAQHAMPSGHKEQVQDVEFPCLAGRPRGMVQGVCQPWRSLNEAQLMENWGLPPGNGKQSGF